MYQLKVEALSKRFGSRKVLSSLNFSLTTGQSLAIVGHNGSGKSTLLKVILSLFRPSKGTVKFMQGETLLNDEQIRSKTSFVAPYLNLYDHLTAEENLKFFATVAGGNVTGKEIDSLLALVGLDGRGMDYVSEYSSGMQQRLKYAVALLKKPDFLFIDEPSSNLDDDGKKIVTGIIEQYRSNSIIVIATNDKEEYALAEELCRLD